MPEETMTTEQIRVSLRDIQVRLEVAKKEENAAIGKRRHVEWELRRLQRRICPHANTKEYDGPWQGGGLYFRRVECFDCGRKGSRYDRELTNQKNREWHELWKLKDEPAEAPERCYGFTLDDDEYNW